MHQPIRVLAIGRATSMALVCAALATACTVIEIRTPSSVDKSVEFGQLTVRTIGNEPVVIRQRMFGMQVTDHRFTVGYSSDLSIFQRLNDERHSILVVGDADRAGVPACTKVTIEQQGFELCRILGDEN